MCVLGRGTGGLVTGTGQDLLSALGSDGKVGTVQLCRVQLRNINICQVVQIKLEMTVAVAVAVVVVAVVRK